MGIRYLSTHNLKNNFYYFILKIKVYLRLQQQTIHRLRNPRRKLLDPNLQRRHSQNKHHLQIPKPLVPSKARKYDAISNPNVLLGPKGCICYCISYGK